MKKISLMLKLLSITALLSFSTTVLSAEKTVEQRVQSYEKHRLRKNPNITLNNIKLVFKKDLGGGWNGYVYSLDLTIKNQKKDIQVNDTLFSNGKMITAELKLMNGLDLKRKMHPLLDERYYKDSHLIAGNKNAKHKLVIFSDPLCPLCTEDTPKIIKDVQNNPNMFALYYVAFPLDMHPTAKTLSKATMIAHAQGVKNVDYKVYTANFDKEYDPYESKDDEKSLKLLNKVLGTNITMSQVNSSKIEDKLKYDLKLANDALVNGTPTLFVDGEIDLTRSSYKKFIK